MAPAPALPELRSRDDAAYLDFVEGFRDYILGAGGADFEGRLDAAARVEAERRGRPWDDAEQLRRWLQRFPLTQLRDRLTRTQQEMKWRRLRRALEAQRSELLAELKRFDALGPGRLLLDPAFVVPAYANVHFHLQPGGYYKDELAGFLYHYGTKVFFRGGNDQDELHGKLVAGAPAPADGRVARVLDLACSVGQSTTAFKRRFPNADVWGIDYSAPMLRVAHRRAVLQNVDVTFAQRLIEHTGFPDAHFDVAFAFIVFHELPLRIIEQTVREIARVTRRGGRFIVYDFNGTASMSPYQRYHRWFDARHNGEPYSQDFCDCDFTALLTASGFAVDSDVLGQRAGGAGEIKHWFATRV
ncbi:MAG: class I SAM-dependent methyltransferase [Steroidobacteraceae bacterium]|nr:class I SAM-dependent methyltransferase [Steroidobacteraceae bacterium]MDW8257875.1 class I SAM-dependent methyltransferase [Gammaproteobacteria bacterium]